MTGFHAQGGFLGLGLGSASHGLGVLGYAPDLTPGRPLAVVANEPRLAVLTTLPTEAVLSTRWYQNDTLPSLEATLKQGGEPIDLDGATVTLLYRRLNDDTIVERACSIGLPAASGEVLYAWQEEELETVGTYACSFLVDYGGGQVLTCPAGQFVVAARV
jgi:hypothetical protein